MKGKKTFRLSDYKPYPFLIPKIYLEFIIDKTHVTLFSCMHIEPISGRGRPLILQGIELELKEISIDDLELDSTKYKLDSTELIIYDPPESKFTLKTKIVINPFLNTSLEGLYSSCDTLTTQCEAEGFRRISFHPDRPDVLSKYRVRIVADRKLYPVLLSNGNEVKSNTLSANPSTHEVIWEDPYPKPSYLFALVAGRLNEVKDSYETLSGRSIDLRLHVEPGNEKFTIHAMKSLKKAMEWDEKEYGLEYDLDEYNIVAVRHFNMGAMENKSLNIFNSKLILADEEIATDEELERIESVVAHEYFHNWTGNRITCRDWFQLSLKEGLTVFRDQCFTSDMHSYAVKRVEDVSLLRNTQFREDSGPTAHAVKPSKYLAVDNFYTTTIYEKGAELIRMLRTLLGYKKFMSGMDIYVQRFDGSAATTEDFVQAIAYGASNKGRDPLEFNLDEFCRWYNQIGTPEITVSKEWDVINRTLKLKFKYSSKIHLSKSTNQALVIPILVAIIGDKGRIGNEKLLIFDKKEQDFTIKDVPVDPTPIALSLFRGFSAPVNWSVDSSDEELFHLFRLDDDPFSRWDAGQSLMRKVLLARADSIPNIELEDKLFSALGDLIVDFKDKDQSILATLLTIPGMSELENCQELVDPLSLSQAIIDFKVRLGLYLGDILKLMLKRNTSLLSEKWPLGKGERRLARIAWSWLAVSGDQKIRKEALQAVSGSSMTMARARLTALHPVECIERENALANFYESWKDRPLVLDAWFALEASAPRANGLDRIKFLLEHSRFDCMAPNAVRAVLGGLSNNSKVFHSLDGRGYMFMTNQLIALDKRNPITASRMVKVFSNWRHYIKPHNEMMLKSIQTLASEKLSCNTREVVDLIQSS